MEKRSWHAMSLEDVVSALKTDVNEGLSSAETARRFADIWL